MMQGFLELELFLAVMGPLRRSRPAGCCMHGKSCGSEQSQMLDWFENQGVALTFKRLAVGKPTATG